MLQKLPAQTYVGDPFTDPFKRQYQTPTVLGPGKVRLTLSEIEELRAAAKENAKLKDILRKFSGLIEIAVDFG